MEVHLPILIKETYCPAKGDFVRAGGAEEFRQRAASKCKDDPPVTSGAGGAEVTLEEDCRAIFDSSCGR